MRRRRTHQPAHPVRGASPANMMRFGGMGVVLVIVIIKAILLLMRDG